MAIICIRGDCPVTARTVQGMAPYHGRARCLALGFWPECFRRLNVKGGRRPFPEETRSALDIEGKHVTIQGPSPDLTSSVSVLAKVLAVGSGLHDPVCRRKPCRRVAALLSARSDRLDHLIGPRLKVTPVSLESAGKAASALRTRDGGSFGRIASNRCWPASIQLGTVISAMGASPPTEVVGRRRCSLPVTRPAR